MSEATSHRPATGDRIEGPRFAMVPEWVIYADVSSHAVRVYAVLHRHSPNVHPGMRRIAEYMHVSVDTVRRAVEELEKIGAVQVIPRYEEGTKHQLSHAWVLASDRPAPPSTGATPLHGRQSPPSTGATTPLAPVLPEGEQDKDKKGTRAAANDGLARIANPIECRRCDSSGMVEDRLGQWSQCPECNRGAARGHRAS